jgi:hypothetical protein
LVAIERTKVAGLQGRSATHRAFRFRADVRRVSRKNGVCKTEGCDQQLKEALMQVSREGTKMNVRCLHIIVFYHLGYTVLR